ncbi:MAG: PTPA-CTERM sorting domain-containing protein [Synechococcales bacterium]|nr:PTPA-CTERM sorting domain-containing protein [Synechococcales bacterium]
MQFLSQSFTKLALGAVLVGSVLTGGFKPAIAANLESEANNDLLNATSLDSWFTEDPTAPDIGLSNFYKTASVRGRGAIDSVDFDPEDFDFFSFTVAQAGIAGIFDIDRTRSTRNVACDYSRTGVCRRGTVTTNDIGFDTFLFLLDDLGNQLSLPSDDELADPGSLANSPFGGGQSLDAYLRWVFDAPGTYYLGVGFKTLPDYRIQRGDYTLHASLSTQPIPTPALLPGLLGFTAALRRKVKRDRSIV